MSDDARAIDVQRRVAVAADQEPVAGGEPTPLTESTTDAVLVRSFFPADDRILYSSDQGGNELNHLYVREQDGSGEPRHLGAEQLGIAGVPAVRDHQCDRPACTTVCPVQATFSLDNGIVYIDPHRCIGCGYCMAPCPYGVRFIHPTRGVAEKCDWCWPRVRDGHGPPVGVGNCPGGAMVFGDLSDPKTEISRILASEPATVLKPESGNKPLTYYIGLDDEAARLVDGEGGH